MLLFSSIFKKTPKTKKEEDIIETIDSFIEQRISSSKAWQEMKAKNPHLYETFYDLLPRSF